MQKHQIQVSQDDIERVDTLRYMWAKVQEQVCSLQGNLLKIQPKFRSTLLVNVEDYQQEVTSYVGDYTKVRTCLHVILCLN